MIGILGAVAIISVEAIVDQPQQIHVAYAGAPAGTAMTVSWQTTTSHPSSVAKYGLASSNLNNTAVGTVSSYYATFDYHVVLSPLTPGTLYFYSCGDTTAGFSPVYNFTTAPASGAEFPMVRHVYRRQGIHIHNTRLHEMRAESCSIWRHGNL
jgi:hypothetical protein